MTIRHLLAHTSGIGYPFSSPVVARLVERTATRETELPLLHDPGERWTYGASTHVLGRIVERISGQPLDAFLRARVFDPLRMSETSYAVPSHKVPRVATVHRRVGGRLVEQPNASQQAAPVRGDGGLYSTADDYGRFLRMLLGGGALHSTRLLSERSVRLMGENQIGTLKVEEQPAADPTLTRPFPMGAGRDRFGLGFQIAAQERRDAPLRSAGSLSWAGINNTHFWVDATRGIAAVVLMQVLPFYDEACMRTLRGFEELLYQHLG
jgi:CubicO group peptidase (beta-lactamase class C family)